MHPHVPINSHIDIKNYRASDVAHQLTLLYMERYYNNNYIGCLREYRFQSIMPYEFSHAAWTRSNSASKAPNITDIIHFTNRLSQWVISAIVTENTTKLLGHFIEIAYVIPSIFITEYLNIIF